MGDWQMSGDAVEDEIPPEFGEVIRHDDGSATIIRNDHIIEIGSDGSTRISGGTIQKISVDSLVDLVHHEIKSDQTAVSHHLRFRNGGEFRFVYRSDGSIIELSGSKMEMSFGKDGTILLSSGSES